MIPGNLGIINFYISAIIKLSNALPYIFILMFLISKLTSAISAPKPRPFEQGEATNLISILSYNWDIKILRSPFCFLVKPIFKSRCPSKVRLTFLAWILKVWISLTLRTLAFQLIVISCFKFVKLYLALTPEIVVSPSISLILYALMASVICCP